MIDLIDKIIVFNETDNAVLTTFATRFPPFLRTQQVPPHMHDALEIASQANRLPAYFAAARIRAARATRACVDACGTKIPQ